MGHTMSAVFRKASFLYGVTHVFLLFVAKTYEGNKRAQKWSDVTIFCTRCCAGLMKVRREIWQEDLLQNQTHHTLRRPAKSHFFTNVNPAITMHIRVWKCFRQITKYPARGSSLCTRIVRLLPKNVGENSLKYVTTTSTSRSAILTSQHHTKLQFLISSRYSAALFNP